MPGGDTVLSKLSTLLLLLLLLLGECGISGRACEDDLADSCLGLPLDDAFASSLSGTTSARLNKVRALGEVLAPLGPTLLV